MIFTVNLVMESQPMDEASQYSNLCPQEVLVQCQRWLLTCLLQQLHGINIIIDNTVKVTENSK